MTRPQKIFTIGVLLVLTVAAVGVTENHINSLSYKFRDCTEISNNSGFIGFSCPNRNPAYPASKFYISDKLRDQVKGDLSPLDTGNGSL